MSIEYDILRQIDFTKLIKDFTKVSDSTWSVNSIITCVHYSLGQYLVCKFYYYMCTL